MNFLFELETQGGARVGRGALTKALLTRLDLLCFLL